MPQCEMCGAEQASLTTTKVEGAELDLCDTCKGFGTEVRQETPSGATSKYSTSSSSGTAKSSSGASGTGSSGPSKRKRRDMFDQMEEVATDYDVRIRNAREARSQSQEELAKELNLKASIIRKLERGDVLPPDDVRKKLESKLDISLLEGVDVEEEWDSGDSSTMTLGDVVKRKD